MKTPFLDFYKDCLKSKRMPKNGLCHSMGFDMRDLLSEFRPTWEDERELSTKGFCTAYWASGVKEGSKDEVYKFTPLRQTIILLCAAINNEL